MKTWRKWSIPAELSVMLRRLDDLATRISKDNIGLDTLNKFRSALQHKEEKETTEAIAQIEEKLRLVSSYQKIARAHISSIPKEAYDPVPFDQNDLARTQALIDNRSQADENARDLFLKASGQKLYLEEQICQARHSVERALASSFSKIDKTLAELQADRSVCEKEYISILNSGTFRSWEMIPVTKLTNTIDENGSACIGYEKKIFPVPQKPSNAILKAFNITHFIHEEDNAYYIDLPLYIDVMQGGSLMIQTESLPDQRFYSCAERISLFTIAHKPGQIKRVDYIDPVNLNSTHFPRLAELSKEDSSIVRSAPASPQEAKTRLQELDSLISLLERGQDFEFDTCGTRLVVILDQFPREYSADDLAITRRLCLNAQRYGILIIMIGSKPSHSSLVDNDIVCDIANCSMTIEQIEGKLFAKCSSGEMIGFSLGPEESISFPKLLNSLKMQLKPKRADNHLASFLRRHPLPSPPKKGNREIRDIPLGIDDQGDTLSISFENECFATFICGAARSGKSTLLHTLLTGIFLSKHPDDVEVWLVDFKMTEFSRYIDNIPPHVKYVVLDESPELVYDLIDRLTSYLKWRQARFQKRGWEKLKDAQDSGEYMPAVLVVIDEFSIMSKIIADSIILGNNNYRDKMKSLLAKGAALGFRFIFSSQGFTGDTRGIPDTDQIQQRIALKTKPSEIKAALEVRNTSPHDEQIIDNLQPHYALLRQSFEEDTQTNRIKRAHVFFLENRGEQSFILNHAFSAYTSTGEYAAHNPSLYRRRTPFVLNGNELKDYTAVEALIQRKQDEGIDRARRDCETSMKLACIGEPRRLEQYCPIELIEDRNENILLFSSLLERESVRSIIATLAKSLKTQNCETHLCMRKRNEYLKGVASKLPVFGIHSSLEEVCSFLHGVKQRVEASEQSSMLVVLFDIEQLFEAMDNLPKTAPQQTSPTYSKRKEGEEDLNTRLARLIGGTDVPPSGFPSASQQGVTMQVFETEPKAPLPPEYDAREDILTMFARGSRLGYHFLLICEEPRLLHKLGIRSSWFRHTVFFKTQIAPLKSQVPGLIATTEFNAIKESDSICFRYCSRGEGVTFRPYAHNDLSILASAEDDDRAFFYDD